MKKIILAIALIFFSTLTFAQKLTQAERQVILDKKKTSNYVSRDSLNYPTKYCLLLATGKMFSKEVDIRIDYGQDVSFFEDTKIRDKNGKTIIFNTVIDALNYMESLGWKYVNAYAITIGNQNVYHFLLKAGDNMNEDYIPKTKRDFKIK